MAKNNTQEQQEPFAVFERGDRGEGVRELQQRLADQGLEVGDVDGIYGGKTQTAALEYQRRAGDLNQTGVFDGATYNALMTREPVTFGTPLTQSQATPPPVAGEAQEDTFLTDLTEFLKEEESFRAEPYRATQGEEHLTIGYGHYGSDVKQGQRLTQQEAEDLLVQDINQRLPAVRSNIPAFDNLSSNLRVQIAQSWFRGGIAGSPNTIRLINQGKFSEAADEFLDNDEYRNAAQRGRRGVIARMDGLANALRAEAN